MEGDLNAVLGVRAWSQSTRPRLPPTMLLWLHYTLGQQNKRKTNKNLLLKVEQWNPDFSNLCNGNENWFEKSGSRERCKKSRRRNRQSTVCLDLLKRCQGNRALLKRSFLTRLRPLKVDYIKIKRKVIFFPPLSYLPSLYFFFVFNRVGWFYDL